VDVDARKVAIWMVVAGGITMAIGMIGDAVRHADDPTLITREGIFDLSSSWHVLIFGGIVVAAVGTFVLAFGAQLYKPGARVTVGRRLAQVGAPMAAVVLIAGCAAVAGNSDLAQPSTPAAAAAHDESHDESHGGSHDNSSGTHATTGAHDQSHSESAVVPPKPYDPSLPIDLGGVPGVTPQQQARAENLIAITLADLPRFADYHTAEAAGYRSIGDAVTGDEHFINVAYFDDGRILDPEYPESLVYEPDPSGATGKKLVAAMYMLAPNQTLDDVPDVGGPLTQWHIHDNLCFTADGKVAGLTSNGGPCRPGLNKGSQAPMIHVWIVPNKCGPFAALEGVGAGQIRAGETRLCDTAHGSHG
jgi:hypothetical protein